MPFLLAEILDFQGSAHLIGVASKVKIYKHENGYRAQVTWVDNLKKEDGSIRTDEKNPDKNKRNVRADQMA